MRGHIIPTEVGAHGFHSYLGRRGTTPALLLATGIDMTNDLLEAVNSVVLQSTVPMTVNQIAAAVAAMKKVPNKKPWPRESETSCREQRGFMNGRRSGDPGVWQSVC